MLPLPCFFFFSSLLHLTSPLLTSLPLPLSLTVDSLFFLDLPSSLTSSEVAALSCTVPDIPIVNVSVETSVGSHAFCVAVGERGAFRSSAIPVVGECKELRDVMCVDV